MDATTVVRTSAIIALVGALTSGPLGLWLVAATYPQPAWRDAATFVAAYHPVQSIPYVFGFLLVGGFVGLVAGLHALALGSPAARTVAALPLAGAFAAMVFVNYAIQTTFVPALVASSQPDDLPLIAGLTMVNPRSVGWALEMWGYAVLGAATWLVAAVFDRGGLESAARWLFVANGPLSAFGGVATALWPGWVMTSTGLVAFGAWNVLVIAMAVLTIVTMSRRAARTDRSPSNVEAPTVSIRREDLDARPALGLIAALNAELTGAYPEPGANHFGLDPADVAPGRGAFFIAYQDERPVGCGAVRLIDPTTAELKRMYVEPAWRGAGLGRRLVEALEAEARRLGAERVVLETGIRQTAALALYARCGFDPIPLYGEYCLSPTTSICLGKSLRS